MKFDLNSYKPIDYRQWILGEEARQGINIKKLGILTNEELIIWNKTIPYQDQRNDPGHGEQAVYFSLKLLLYYPNAKREIIVPSAIFHDVGWFGNNPEAWKKLVEANKDNLQALESEASRRPHQNRGIAIAGMILAKTNYADKYPVEYLLEIADIIGDHDTRKLPATDNGKIIRIADLLWRATYPHAQIYMENYSPEEIVKRFEATCISDELLPYLGEIGIQIAKLEFANMIFFKFGKDTATRVLSPKYSTELKRIIDFYK